MINGIISLSLNYVGIVIPNILLSTHPYQNIYECPPGFLGPMLNVDTICPLFREVRCFDVSVNRGSAVI